mgnify:CR=1 FL=1
MRRNDRRTSALSGTMSKNLLLYIVKGRLGGRREVERGGGGSLVLKFSMMQGSEAWYLEEIVE